MKHICSVMFLLALTLLVSAAGCAEKEPPAIRSQVYRIYDAQVCQWIPVGAEPYEITERSLFSRSTMTTYPPESGTKLCSGQEADGRLLLSVHWGAVTEYEDGRHTIEDKEQMYCTMLASQARGFDVESPSRASVFSFPDYETFASFFSQQPNVFFQYE